MQDFDEMFYYSGREYYLDDIIAHIKELFGRCIKDGYFQEGMASNLNWLEKLVYGLCEYNGKKLVERAVFDIDHIKMIKQALCND